MDLHTADHALKLEPGHTYVIECERLMSLEQIDGLRNHLEQQAPGVRFILFGAGMTIAKPILFSSTEDANEARS